MSRSRYREHEEEESYFVSMTDMMIGVLFIFIIMIMVFALNMKKAEDNLLGAKDGKKEMLEKMENALKESGVEVYIDYSQGILRLPEQILFEKGKAEIKAEGATNLEKLAKVMGKILPCYLPQNENYSCMEEYSSSHLDALLIEGHTDTSPYAEGAKYDNWNLSSDRAINTYRELIYHNQLLGELVNPSHQKLLSVSGYGQTRLIDEAESEDAQRKNRRIDLRFIMATPSDKTPKERLENELQK